MSISTSDKLNVEIMDHTALITIDNPGANTWDTESLPALAALIDALNADKNIYALVITGQGEKFFSAGADLNLFADGDPDNARQMAEFFGKGFECLANFRGVSIAAINGFPWVAAWKPASPVIFASLKLRPRWHYPNLRWVCCPAPAAPNASRG